jgi:uncharacterized protein (DUF58 family)
VSELRSTKDLLKKIRHIEIRTNRLVNDVFAGEYHSVFKGRGMEFDEVREYTPGDDIRAIDWNVTARHGHPFVKRYVEERELTVMLVVDASASGLFGTAGQVKSELATELCALLAFSAIRNNDRVGLIVFTDRVEKYIAPNKGHQHVLRVILELLNFRPEGKGTDIAEALSYLNRVRRRQSVVFLISDFLAEEYRQALLVTSKRHDVIALAVTDQREIDMPDVGLLELEDAESGETTLVDTSSRGFREAYAQQSRSRRARRDQIFRSINVDRIDMYTGQSYVKPITAFFKERARRFR